MKEFLSQQGVEWTEKYVDADRAAAIEMIRRSGQNGVPVTVIGDEVVVGFNRPKLERIVASLKAAAAQAGGSDGSTKRKSLGAKVADASRYALQGGIAMQGAYVGGVNPGSPAEAAGLKAGDVITAVDHASIASVDELSKALASRDGRPITLTVARGKTTREVQVRL